MVERLVCLQLDEFYLLLPSSKIGEIIACIIPLLEHVRLLSCSHAIVDRAQPGSHGLVVEPRRKAYQHKNIQVLASTEQNSNKNFFF